MHARVSVKVSGIDRIERTLRERLVMRCDKVRQQSVRGRLIHLVNRTNGWARGTKRFRLSRDLDRLKSTIRPARKPRRT